MERKRCPEREWATSLSTDGADEYWRRLRWGGRGGRGGVEGARESSGLRKYAPFLCLNRNCQSWREKGQPVMVLGRYQTDTHTYTHRCKYILSYAWVHTEYRVLVYSKCSYTHQIFCRGLDLWQWRNKVHVFVLFCFSGGWILLLIFIT